VPDQRIGINPAAPDHRNLHSIVSGARCAMGTGGRPRWRVALGSKQESDPHEEQRMTQVVESSTAVTAGPEIPLVDVAGSTRYLCSAPYLRRSMIPRRVAAGPKRPGNRKREELVVGGAFCRLALSEGALLHWMTAVDIAQVVRHAHIGRRQARIRDTVLCGLLAACAVLAPLGSLVWLLLCVSLRMLPWMWGRWKRRRLRIAGLLAASLIVVVTVIVHRGDEARSLMTPLAALACCQAVYAADAVLCWCRIRRLPRSLSRAPVSRFSAGRLHAGLAAARNAAHENVVGYERDRIVGLGKDFGKHTLTVPINEPEEGETVQRFLASDLLNFIAWHIRDQGLDDTVTHALPDLQVGTVLAQPMRPTRHESRRLDETRLHGKLKNPPSSHAERVYTRAQATGWGGEVVGTIFISVALEGRFLRLVVLPYVLGPIAPELRVADAICQRNLATHLLFTPGIAAHELRLAIRAAQDRLVAARRHPRRDRPQPPRSASEDDPPETQTLRERYSVDTADDMHQTEDGVRWIQIMEQRVFAVTEIFLKDHGISTARFEQQVSQVLNSYVIIGSNNNLAAGANSQAGDGTVPNQQ
jgi:hypothetical protein